MTHAVITVPPTIADNDLQFNDAITSVQGNNLTLGVSSTLSGKNLTRLLWTCVDGCVAHDSEGEL